MINNTFKKFFIGFTILLIFVPSLFISPIFSNNTNLDLQNINEKINIDISSSQFKWPIPGYTKISSYYGKRNSPTSGASTFHLGIDIPAPPRRSINCSI